MNDVMLACLNIMSLCCGPSGLPPGGSTRRRLAGELFEKLLISKSLAEYGPRQGPLGPSLRGPSGLPRRPFGPLDALLASRYPLGTSMPFGPLETLRAPRDPSEPCGLRAICARRRFVN